MIQRSSNNDRKNCEDNKLYYKNEKKLKTRMKINRNTELIQIRINTNQYM